MPNMLKEHADLTAHHRKGEGWKKTGKTHCYFQNERKNNCGNKIWWEWLISKKSLKQFITQEESCSLKEPAWVYSRADHNEQISFICVKKIEGFFLRY